MHGALSTMTSDYSSSFVRDSRPLILPVVTELVLMRPARSSPVPSILFVPRQPGTRPPHD